MAAWVALLSSRATLAALVSASVMLFAPATALASFETWEGFSASNPMPAGRVPGSSGSPFNLEVGPSPKVLSNSKAMVEYLLSTNKEGPENKEPAADGGIPTVYASNSDPVLELVSEVEHNGYDETPINHIKIHVPASTQTQHPVDETPPKEEGSSDAHLQIVLSPKDDETLGKPSGTTVDMWQVRTKEGSIDQGGHLYFTAGGFGSLTGNLVEVEGGAADAAGFVLNAGMVRGPELKAGSIHHALFAAINTCKKEKGTSIFVFPASSSDCGTEGKTEAEEAAIPAEGQRFYLDYSDKEIEELATKEKFQAWKVAILKALSHYGFYIGDSGNCCGIALKWEDADMYTAFGVESPFNEIGKEQGVETSGGNYVFNLMKGVEWSRLKAISRPAPAAITEAASAVKSTEATLNGTVNPEGLETKYYFEYGETTSYGKKTTEASAGSGTTNSAKSKTITGLEAEKTYHFRVVTTSSAGTTDGEDHTFTATNLPVNTALPIVSPITPDQNIAEASTSGSWTNSPTSYSYQWEHCNAEGKACEQIPGATSSTYTPEETYVGDTLAAKVTATNSAGSSSATSVATNKVEPIGHITEYSLPSGSRPVGIAAGPDGNLWFTDEGTSKIGKITTSGTVTEYALPSGSKPMGIAAGPDGNLWFTDEGTSKIGKITTSGTVTEYALPSGSKPVGITSGPESRLWYTNAGTSKIGKITTSGTITEYALPTGSEPFGITEGPDGNAWFTDNATRRVGKITASGTITEYETRFSPYYITPGPTGNEALWFTDYKESKSFISEITTSGTITNDRDKVHEKGRGITAASNGTMWYTQWAPSAVGTYVPTAEDKLYSLPSGSEPEDITQGPDKNLWFTDKGTSKIGKIVP